MLRQLALTVEPVDRETLPSLLSRMAILNGTDAANFALDLGATFRRILEQDEEAVAIFAERAGLSATELAEMLSWTGERIGDVRMRFRKEVFVSRALRNPIIRGCPHCMRDYAADLPHPLRHIALRGAGFAEALISATSTTIRWFPCGPAHAPSNGMTLERDWRKSCQTCEQDHSTACALILPTMTLGYIGVHRRVSLRTTHGWPHSRCFRRSHSVCLTVQPCCANRARGPGRSAHQGHGLCLCLPGPCWGPSGSGHPHAVTGRRTHRDAGRIGPALQTS